MPRRPNTVLIYEKVPAHLRELREKAGLTQRDLAELLNKPQSWVARCETAARRVDVAEWVEWCFACGVNAKVALDDLVQRRRLKQLWSAQVAIGQHLASIEIIEG